MLEPDAGKLARPVLRGGGVGNAAPLPDRRNLTSFNRHRVSRTRRTQMGVRIVVQNGETIEQAVKRFKKLVWRFGPPGAGGKLPRWHKPPLDHYLKPGELRRRAEYVAARERRRIGPRLKPQSPFWL